jgi:hypothetical protein
MAKTPGSPPETTATLTRRRGLLKRRACAREFFAIVGRDRNLIGAQSKAVEIGLVAVEILGIHDRVHGLRRDLVRRCQGQGR